MESAALRARTPVSFGVPMFDCRTTVFIYLAGELAGASHHVIHHVYTKPGPAGDHDSHQHCAPAPNVLLCLWTLSPPRVCTTALYDV